MGKAKAELGLKEELMILQFWALGRAILQKFSQEQIQAVPGLKEAIDAVSGLPGEIGWGDEPQRSCGHCAAVKD
ncbi:hypothetical protein [Microvirga pakistanensis]|uniref:hypothetical protein n=1 Tax=Microvirga pakistanensis TaxID=1682650 RepID=UPI001069C684|nr:hypothetical protein [Microvirga pakistanensis]